jgi:hypothetical protein
LKDVYSLPGVDETAEQPSEKLENARKHPSRKFERLAPRNRVKPTLH